MDIDRLVIKTTEYFRGDGRRIQHFIKVHAYSGLIGRLEGLDAETLEILEAAAVVHDVGIRAAEEKYGYQNGKLQEELGPDAAMPMLISAGASESQMERIRYLIAHHHTYSDIKGMDYQILVEADFLVNLQEEGNSRESIESVYKKIFVTESGRKQCRDIFGLQA